MSFALTMAFSGSGLSGVGISGGGGAGGGGGYATPAHVQSNSGYSNGPATLSSNSTTGNTLVVFVSGSSSVSSTTVSGGGVTTWYSATAYNDVANTYGRFFYGYVATGGAVSITISSPPTDPGWSIYEISGVASGDCKDDESGFVGDGEIDTFDSIWTSGNATATQAGAAIGAWASESFDPGISWASGWGNTTLQNSHYHGTAFKAVEAGDHAASGTCTTKTNGVAIVLLLKAASL